MFNTIQILQVRDGQCVIYDEPVHGRRKFANNILNRQRMSTARKLQYSGKMTRGAAKRMTRAINLLSLACPARMIFNPVSGRLQHHQLTFITLTISSKSNVPTDVAYKELLKPFLEWMRDTKGVKSYIWKLEFQQRGQPHYHITIPDFIDYREVRRKWNQLQRKNGYLDQWAADHNYVNVDPNSTDVHAVRTKESLASYIVKELCKTIDAKRLHAKDVVESLIQAGEIPADKKQDFINDYAGEEMKALGKVWGCSENLHGAVYFITPLERWHVEQIERLRQHNYIGEKTGDHWSIIWRKSNAPPLDLLNDNERKKLQEHLDKIINPPECIPDYLVNHDQMEVDELYVDETNSGFKPFCFQGELF